MVYRFGDCLLDTQRHTLRRAGQPVRLRAKAFQVLRYLLEHRHRVVPKQELYEQVWPQQFVSEATLESTVRAVRQAIGDNGRAQQFIQTVYGGGYRFIAAVEVCADMSPGAAGDALQSLPGSASAPPPGDGLHAAPTPLAPESAGGDDRRRAPGLRDAGEPTPQHVEAELAPERPAVPSPVWEQKPVAVLAVELTFPTMPEDAAAAYEPWTAASRWEQALVAKTQGFGGVVIQRSPSLLLVAFGIPQTLEQLPQRAVQAALALRQLVVDRAEREPCPELRVAVHWGPLLVDVQAHDPAMPLRAFGDTLAWPVRLLGQAAPGDILLSPELGPLVDGWCEVQAREVPLHTGAPGRIKVYAVVGNRPHGARLELHGRLPLSRFVGRERELALLHDLLPEVEGGRGQVVGMIGEPGVGKSRLCDEFIRGALAPPWLILETQGTAYGQATPYRPIIDLLKGYFRIEDRGALPTVCEQVTATLHGLDDALTPTAPAFLALLDLPVADPQWQALEATQRRQRTLDAIKRLLLRESQRQPLLLVVENLHWVDTETQAVLDTLVESLPAARLFLLATYRPEYHHHWGNKTYYTQLRLDPLPRESARALVNSLLGDDAGLQALKRRLIEWTHGNPFFLEESVRTLLETQVLAGERGAYRPVKAMQTLQVPATVQAVLAARMDRLPAEEKRLLQAAAVIGKDVPFAVLQAIAGLPEGILHRGLAHLRAAEFLYETRLFPELEYTFKHALTHEVAYGGLPHERRRSLHAQIVEAIERLSPERLPEQADRLAQHALRGKVWEKAVAYCRQAGAKAFARSANREAVAYFEQALGAIEHVPACRETREQAIDLRIELRNALSQFRDERRIFTCLREAEALAQGLNDQRRLGRISAYLSSSLCNAGAHGRAIACGRRALVIAEAVGDVALQVVTRFHLGQAYLHRGEYRRAIDCLRWNIASLPGDMLHARLGMAGLPAVVSRAPLAIALAECGEFADGMTRGEEGLQLAGAVDHPASLIAICHGLGQLYLHQGDLQRAIPVLERGLGLARTWNILTRLPGLTSALGSAYALSGRLAEALPLLEEAVVWIDSRQIRLHLSRATAGLSQADLLAGRLEEAHALADRALALAREHQERGNEAYALRLLGDITARRDPPEVAQVEAYYRQAMALAEGRGMRPLQAHCHLGLGSLFARTGRREQARAGLAAALALYRGMDMMFWLPQAEAMLAQVEGG